VMAQLARAEALELVDRLRLAVHDCDVLTADAPLLDSSSVPVELDEPDSEVEVLDSELLGAPVDSDLLATSAARRRAALADRAGSCPEASWTYTIANTSANMVTASPATDRRMRRVRRRSASRRLLASALASICPGVLGESLTVPLRGVRRAAASGAQRAHGPGG
jgi:hypothetical protein